MFEACSFTSTEKRDPRREDEVLRWLRPQPEPLRLRFVTQVVAQSYPGAHEFIRRAQLSPHSLEQLFRGWLLTADASTIRYWLAAVMDGLGWRRVIELPRQHIPYDAAVVGRALYWLPSLLPAGDAEARLSYEELRDSCTSAA
jgi:hypothetical protein